MREILGKKSTDKQIEEKYDEEGVTPPWMGNSGTKQRLFELRDGQS
jgi:hypothetical protein